MIDRDRVRELAKRCLPDIIELRHAIHAHPELSGEETETSARVRKILAGTTAEILPPFLETDVVAIMQGRGRGPNLTLRADMDALALTEQCDVPYASQNPGVMHACGHDGHTAMLAGAALILNELTDLFSGSVRFVFQPGEEMLCLGKSLIEAGALENPKPDHVIALHAWPELAAGVIGGRPGPMMAAANEFHITISGRGGHGAAPHKTIDPLLTAARLVDAIQAIASRMADPCEPVVVSVCQLHAGAATNVIPSEARLSGTTRFFNPDIGQEINDALHRITKGVCDSMGAKFDITIDSRYVPLRNSTETVDLGRSVARSYLGETAWADLPQPSMGAEDFAFYLQDCPGAFFRIGMGHNIFPHNPCFNFSDDALLNGMLFHVFTALTVCGSGPDQSNAS